MSPVWARPLRPWYRMTGVTQGIEPPRNRLSAVIGLLRAEWARAFAMVVGLCLLGSAAFVGHAYVVSRDVQAHGRPDVLAIEAVSVNEGARSPWPYVVIGTMRGRLLREPELGQIAVRAPRDDLGEVGERTHVRVREMDPTHVEMAGAPPVNLGAPIEMFVLGALLVIGSASGPARRVLARVRRTDG